MIFKVVARARRRLLWNAIAGEGIRAVSAGMGALVLLLVFGTEILSWRWVWAVPSIIFAAGVSIAFKRRPDAYGAAQRIDSRLRLADTLSTAVFFWLATPSRQCDEGTRLRQRERAAEIAVGVDLRSALPLRIPRSICAWAIALAVLAAGLLTLRYHFAGRIDLRAPASAAIMQLVREAKTDLAKLQKALETPAPDKADGNIEPADNKASEKADGTAADANDLGKAESTAGGEEKRKSRIGPSPPPIAKKERSASLVPSRRAMAKMLPRSAPAAPSSDKAIKLRASRRRTSRVPVRACSRRSAISWRTSHPR